MPYSYITFGEAIDQLAERLNDTGANTFWDFSEKAIYIQEALRTWNSLTNYWRAEFTFETVGGQAWYDITAQGGSLREFLASDSQLLQVIQNHLLEPVAATYPLDWIGTNQFTMEDLLNALQRRMDEMLSVVGCTITRTTVPAVPGRTFLADSVIDIRRIAWLPVANPGNQFTNSPLWPGDQFGESAFDVNFTTRGNGTPMVYMQSAEPPLSFDVDTNPAINGSYEVLTINAGPTLNTTALSILPIPTDFFWVLKFGALADLFGKESNAKDILRQQYCEQRYRQGIAALFNSPAILYARLNNVPLDIDSIQNTDNFRSGWQAENPAQPELMAVAGLNLVALVPPPNQESPGVNYSVTLGVVQNAPITGVTSDKLQVARDDLEIILDYAQHLASLKMGGLEFLATMPMLERFHKQAANYNSKLNELGEFTKPMLELSQQHAEANPVFESDPTVDSKV